jgi:Cysteine-rich secretory protein family
MKLKKLLLPTPENDYTPHFLQKTAMAIMVVLILLSFAAVNIHALLWQSSKWLVGTVLPAVVVDLTNHEREDLSAPTLRRNALLDEAARLKAEHMAKNSYFAHYSPDGVSPWYWFEQVSYQFAHAGENLAIHFTDSGAVVDAWMNSPTHRANIANKNYTEIGVGTAKGTYDGYDTVFVVQLFGTPAAVAKEVVQPAPVPVVLPAEVPIIPVESVAVATIPGPETATTTPELEEVLAAESSQELVLSQQTNSSVPVTNQENEVEARDVFVKADEVATEEPESVPAELPIGSPTGRHSVFLGHFATSSGLPPAALADVSGTTAAHVSSLDTLATRPSSVLQIIYLTLGLFVASLLLVSIMIGVRHHRPLQVAYGLGLLLLMSGLFYVHATLTTQVVIASEPEAKVFLVE